MHKNTMLTLAEFAELLKHHCQGDWWDKIPQHAADPTWDSCESCHYHPMTQEDANLLNRIFAVLKDAGAPSPHSAYPHCAGNIFIEWHSNDGQNSIVMDVKNKFGRDALVRIPPKPTYFVYVGDA